VMKTSTMDEKTFSSRFLHIVQALSRIKDPGIALESILTLGKEILGTDSAAAIMNGVSGPLRVSGIAIDDVIHEEQISSLYELLNAHCAEPCSIQAVADSDAVDTLRRLGGEASHVICFPLTLHGQLLGGLFFFSDHAEIDELPLQWLGILAAQAGLVLENTHLLQATLRQATELGSIYETTSAVVDMSDHQQALELVLERAIDLLGCEGGGIYLVTDEHRQLYLTANLGDSDVLSQLLETFVDAKADGTSEEGDEVVGVETEQGPLHALILGMEWRKELLGYLLLYDSDARVIRTDTSLSMAHLIALQAANVLAVSRLIASEREEKQIAQALEQASLVVNQAMDLDELLDQVLAQVAEAFPCDCTNFMILEGDTSRILRHRGYEQFGLHDEELHNLGLNVEDYENMRRMIAGEVVVIPDTAQSESWVSATNLEWLKSWAGAPIEYAGEIIGFLSLDSGTPGTFTEAMGDRLEAFAAHAATAMRKAELYTRLSSEHGRLNVLYEIARAVSTSLRPGEIQDNLIDGAIRAVEAVDGVVYELAPSKEELTINTRSLFGRKTGGCLKHVACKRFAEEIFSGKHAAFKRLELDGNTVNLVGFPLQTAQMSYGVAVLHVDANFVFSDDWQAVFEAAGQQAGIALDNADKHAQVQRRLAEMTILQRLISAIAGRLDAQDVLDEVTSQLFHALEYPAVQIFQRDDDELVLKSFSGPAPIVEELSIQRGIIGRVARSGEPALVQDVRTDSDYVALLVGTRSLLVVPYRREEELFGVIAVATSNDGQLDRDDLDLLMLLADFVSVALQNAELYEQVRDSVSLLEDQVRLRTAELEDALTKAREAERIKANFVSDISHELRTPLTNIGLYLDLLEIGGKEKAKDYMLTLRRETERLGTLIEQLLAISQLDAGKSALTLEMVDLNGLVEMLVNDRARMIFQSGLVLETELERGQIMVNLDPRLIMQAMTNLLTNAMNYTPLGGTISLRTASVEENGAHWAILTVRDTGPGIAEEEQENIFDRFYRGLAGRSSGISGTGLGLAICKEIMERHHGRVTVKSRLGHGAAFTLWIPCSPNDALAN